PVFQKWYSTVRKGMHYDSRLVAFPWYEFWVADEWRIDKVIKRRAQEGVKVYILVYKASPMTLVVLRTAFSILVQEVTQGMNMSSRHTKAVLYKTVGSLLNGTTSFQQVDHFTNNAVSLLQASLRHRDEWLEKGRRFRQRFHKGPDWEPQEDDHPHDEPHGGCIVQAVRSCSDWSHGVLKESSIQTAYIELIREAEHYIYIENQFFISNTGDYGPVQNRIAQALVERILRAAREGKRFKVVVLLPEVPGFAGDISQGSDLKTILAATWRTINRGGHSIYEEIRAAGYEPSVVEMEENSGVTFHQAQVALAKQWIGVPEVWTQPNVSIKQPDPTKEGLIIEETKTKVEALKYPETVEEAVEIIEKFEAGAIGIRDDHRVSDSIAHHALMDDTNLLQEKWLGTDEEEYESYVSEILYIHSKLMIVDDRRVICGSANINDRYEPNTIISGHSNTMSRSQKGNGDSEIALVVEDTDMIDVQGRTVCDVPASEALQRYKLSANKLPQTDISVEHLGLISPEPVGVENDFMKPAPTPNPDEFGLPEDTLVADPMSIEMEDLWNGTAARNRAIFAELFKTVPSDTVRNFEQYKNYVPKTRAGHLPPGQSLDRVKQRLAQVRGHLVEAPLDFLIDEKGIWENADWMVPNLSFVKPHNHTNQARMQDVTSADCDSAGRAWSDVSFGGFFAIKEPSTAASVVGVGFSSYFLFGNLFAKYGGTLPLSEQSAMLLTPEQKLKSWRLNFEVGKAHLGGSTALAATSYLLAAYYARPGSVSRTPLITAMLASIGVAAFTLLVMTPTNKKLLQLNQDVDAGTLKASNADVKDLISRWKGLHNLRMIIGTHGGSARPFNVVQLALPRNWEDLQVHMHMMITTNNLTPSPIPKKVCRALENGPIPIMIANIAHKALTSRPFILTGAAFVTLLGLNEAGFFKADESHPIKRYMASKIPSNESLLQENLARIEEVKESAADYRLRTSARKRVFKQVKNPGSMALAGDDGLTVAPRQDVNTINPRRTFNEV
ncbi:2129_t:CDS:10, partial [Acaulospora colombiana]